MILGDGTADTDAFAGIGSLFPRNVLTGTIGGVNIATYPDFRPRLNDPSTDFTDDQVSPREGRQNKPTFTLSGTASQQQAQLQQQQLHQFIQKELLYISRFDVDFNVIVFYCGIEAYNRFLDESLGKITYSDRGTNTNSALNFTWQNNPQVGVMGMRGAKIVYDPLIDDCLLYTSPSPRDRQKSRMPSSA